MACWTLEDILKSDAALMPELKLRPVPDSLCPAFRSSFNPYSEKVEVRAASAPAGDVFFLIEGNTQ